MFLFIDRQYAYKYKPIYYYNNSNTTDYTDNEWFNVPISMDGSFMRFLLSIKRTQTSNSGFVIHINDVINIIDCMIKQYFEINKKSFRMEIDDSFQIYKEIRQIVMRKNVLTMNDQSLLTKYGLNILFHIRKKIISAI